MLRSLLQSYVMVCIFLAIIVIITSTVDSGVAKLEPESKRYITWQTGQNIRPGDVYEYHICNSIDAIRYIHPQKCYTLQMHFIYKTIGIHHAYGSSVWVVEVSFDGVNTVMFYDETIIHAANSWDINRASSIQNTILDLSKYGEKRLRVGAHWDDIQTYYYKTPLVISSLTRVYDMSQQQQQQQQPIVNATLEYNAIKRSYTSITSNLAFPTYSLMYDPFSFHYEPEILYEYKLIKRYNLYYN